MATQTLTHTQQSLTAALPGTWKLAPGRAITLRPREAGIVRVAHGQIWVTCDGPHSGPPNDLGDRVVAAGDQLRLRPGQRLVLEAWDSQSPAYFTWDPLPHWVPDAAPRLAQVIQPWSDLRLALLFGAGAAGRLVVGVARLARDLVGGHRREPTGRCPA